MHKILALVVTYKRKELLEKVIQGLLDQTYPISDILIVDNNSSDGTKELVESYSNENTNILYFNTGANLGGAGGFSFGFQKAMDYNFDYLWIMDDDLLPSHSCLETLVSASDENTISQPIRLNTDNSCAEYSPVIFDMDSIFLVRPKRCSVIDYIKNNKSEKIPLQGIPFEGPLIPRKIISDIGYPDKRFFIFYDDLDYALRAQKKGYNIQCILNAHAYRLLMNNQVNDLKSWKGYFMLRNFFRIHKLHGNNFFVRGRPYFLAALYITKELLCFRKRTAVICLHALIDSRTDTFILRDQYIPK